MAGTKSSAHTTHLKPVEVSKALQDGEKFIKWDEDSGVGIPVTLRVDKNGFYLYWVDQNKEMDLIDIATIRDTRTGKYAKVPKDPKLKQIVTMGSQDTLEEKTVTVCCGSDFVNLTFTNFCCTKKEIAKLWTDELVKLAYNILQLNSSAIRFLEKAYSKLILLTDKSGKVPVKNIVKLFAQNKEDRKRVEKALDLSGLPSGKNDALSLQKFQFEDFFNFYKHLAQRSEVEKVFDEICESSKRKLMSAAQFVEFLNKKQRDPRLNEILYPYANTARAKDLIMQYEPNKYNAQKGQFSFDGFLRYLMSEDNPIVSLSKLDLNQDMDQPLSQYFINSSHNTYLTGHQLTGKSSVEVYRQCLLAGCRCVELDFWNGRTDEPVIVHGYTFVPEISAKEVIEAIAESAFKTSDFPVVLSFENHCNPRQQAKIAQYCREIFGENLLDSPLESHKLEPGVLLPPPSLLRRKIIIKNKKKHHHKKSHASEASLEALPEMQGNGDIPHPPLQKEGSKESAEDEDMNDDDEDSSSEEDEDEDDEETAEGLKPQGKPLPDKAVAAKESEAGAEISALVNYVQPVHFNSFESAEKKSRFYEMSSFDEKQATTLLKERPIEFVNYNKHQLSRVYPAGTRFDSSNFMPQVFWNAGCQLVALNYQTLDLAMQLNLGIFEYNLRCGYLLKPEFMRRRDRRFDPFAESTVDGIIAGTVSVQVISAHCLTEKRVGTYVEVEMYGLPADTVRKKFKTKIVPNNGINPVYDEEPFVFKKVVLPELACIRIAAYEESGRPIGHRVLPVVGLCPGYRHVGLRNEVGQPHLIATLFLLVQVKDYVPDGLSDFAEALANPIKYQSELEKRARQLSVLTDDIVEEGVGSGPTEETIDEEEPMKTKRLQSISSIDPATPHPSQPVIPSVSTLTKGISTIAVKSAVADDALGAVAIEVEPVPDASLAVGGSDAQVANSKTPILTSQVSQELVAEPLEKLMENKLVKEKKAEMEKKLESLRRKHEKEKLKVQTQRASQDSERTKPKFYMSHKLVKRLSSKNMEVAPTMGIAPEATSESSECEGDGVGGPRFPGLPRSHSERILALFKEHVSQEKEVKEKYHEAIFSTLEKVMRASQVNQIKTLHVLLERETSEVMRKLQSMRREEVKALSKIHKDKDEMVRIKREVASSMVEKGVNERVRLTQLYEKKREELERQHEEVKLRFEEEKNKARAALQKEYECRFPRVEEELNYQATPSTDASISQ
ncbi:1-phosphatidylinositol 4,5-bisphosphate phosphodiesterase classes I and II [Ischnura elegans]|uniref:1-phosphatidylinositol 4,5-bisphosphate phosphodiesterase classes I and II n=1 Tax=Ischnura elegans TaxID=197161 RepID=UPI001ED8BC6D|nr:1-phosphatidylinositol 4,5-bisphosphate phosphodiesterase classes I and II [Ischnura elegans]